MERSYTEILLSEEEESDALENYINRVVAIFGAKIIDHIYDLDADYVDVEIENEKIRLHRQTFIGISISLLPWEMRVTRQVHWLKKLLGY